MSTTPSASTPDPSATSPAAKTTFYNRFLLFIAGMGGLLYGIDIGIIDPALGYLGKCISLSES